MATEAREIGHGRDAFLNGSALRPGSSADISGRRPLFQWRIPLELALDALPEEPVRLAPREVAREPDRRDGVAHDSLGRVKARQQSVGTPEHLRQAMHGAGRERCLAQANVYVEPRGVVDAQPEALSQQLHHLSDVRVAVLLVVCEYGALQLDGGPVVAECSAPFAHAVVLVDDPLSRQVYLSYRAVLVARGDGSGKCLDGDFVRFEQLVDLCLDLGKGGRGVVDSGDWPVLVGIVGWVRLGGDEEGD